MSLSFFSDPIVLCHCKKFKVSETWQVYWYFKYGKIMEYFMKNYLKWQTYKYFWDNNGLHCSSHGDMFKVRLYH